VSQGRALIAVRDGEAHVGSVVRGAVVARLSHDLLAVHAQDAAVLAAFNAGQRLAVASRSLVLDRKRSQRDSSERPRTNARMAASSVGFAARMRTDEPSRKTTSMSRGSSSCSCCRLRLVDGVGLQGPNVGAPCLGVARKGMSTISSELQRWGASASRANVRPLRAVSPEPVGRQGAERLDLRPPVSFEARSGPLWRCARIAKSGWQAGR